MDSISRRAFAKEFTDSPLYIEIMDEMERNQIDVALHAHLNDDATRQAAIAELRAIRALRSKLKALANEGSANAGAKGSVA